MWTHFYLFHIQYLGFRFHGWQKQPGVKTIESMLRKTATFVLGHGDFRILGSSRTDARVSANHAAFELFLKEPVDTRGLMDSFNLNLPNDIIVLAIEPVHASFAIIQAPRSKEYLYLFAFGETCHPFCAPILSSFPDPLDIEYMGQGARLFEGAHNFRQYCTKPGPGTQFEREINVSRIEENNEYTASFFPEKSYLFRIQSRGFLRNQIRLIMGQLLRLGRCEINLNDIRMSLTGVDPRPFRTIAPASGLILNRIDFD